MKILKCEFRFIVDFQRLFLRAHLFGGDGGAEKL